MVELRLAFVLLLFGCASCAQPTHPKDSCAEGAVPPGTAGAAGDTGATGAAGAAGSEASPGGGGAVGLGSLTRVDAVVDDDFTADVEVAVHDRVKTLLVVTWEQRVEVDQTFVEFEFEGQVMRSRPRAGKVGEHRDVVLGVPELTEVSVRIVSQLGADYVSSRDYEGTTGPLPSRLPRPEVLAYDPQRASPERWLFGSVEDSPGGRDFAYYANTFWLYIMDRQGRIVWYYADPSSNATPSFQRIAKDGEYIWIEKRPFGVGGERGVLKMTLDWEYFEEIEVPGLSDSIDVTDDGSLLYDADDALREMTADGEFRSIWSCREHFGRRFNCYSNTVNYYERDNSVLMSFPVENTVVEIDRESGDLLAQYGSARGSFDFAPPLSTPPPMWSFSFQHFPNMTPDDTLLVSSHMPGCRELSKPVAYQHAFLEFDVDRERRRLTERWRYNDGPEWPRAKGMAIRLGNGNTLVNYGTGGVIREVTPDKRTVFHVKFDTPGGSDFYNKMVGHNVFVDDLYALNGGPR